MGLSVPFVIGQSSYFDQFYDTQLKTIPDEWVQVTLYFMSQKVGQVWSNLLNTWPICLLM